MMVQSGYDMNNLPEPSWCLYAGLGFSILYLTEVLLKLAAMSFAEYWSLRANQFDFITTMLLLVSSIMDCIGMSGPRYSSYANMLRVLRLARMFKQLKSY